MKKAFGVLCLVLAVLCLAGCAGQGSTASESAPIVTEGLPVFTVSGETDLPGNFYISFVYSRSIAMLDGAGNIVWSKHEEQPENGAVTGWWDFKKHEVDGKTYYSYHDQTGEYDSYGLTGFAPGERVILDEDFNEIKRIRFEASDVTEKGDPLDGHDFLMIDLDHYFLSGYIKDTVYNVPGYPEGSSVVYSYLQEVKDGEAVWDWKSADYPELYALTVTDASEDANDFGNENTDVPDYVHFNAMRLNEDGNLVCSFRHLSTVLCLDRTKREDQIIWKLSGGGDEFGLTESQKTSCQHYVTVDGDCITVFNNNNRGGQTGVVSYKLNADDMTAEAVMEYTFPRRFSVACGSAQRVTDEIYTIGWGMATKDKDCMSVWDMTKGTALMTVTLDNPTDYTYRCVYYE